MTRSTKLSSLSAPEEAILRLNLGQTIGHDLAYKALRDTLNENDESRRVYFLTNILAGLIVQVPTANEVVGLLTAAFEKDAFDPTQRHQLVSDKPTITYVGSGKKGFKTVNLSSLAAFVAACQGVTIAKLSAPSTSSMTGSQDFSEVIGSNVQIPRTVMSAIAADVGVGFFPVENVLPKFASLYTGVFLAPHAMSFALAAMTCDFSTDHMLYGVAHPNLGLSLEIFKHYGLPQATVVSSSADNVHYVDEALDCGQTLVQSYIGVEQTPLVIELSGMTNSPYEKVLEAVAQETNAAKNVIKGLSGLTKPSSILAKQIALNAALLLHACSMDNSLETLYANCLETIRTGEPVDKLRQFITATGGELDRFNHLINETERYPTI